MKKLIKSYLEKHPVFRQRTEKNKWIFAIVMKKYAVVMTPKMKDLAAEMMKDLLTADRDWRDILEEEPGLRGTDYEEKVILEQKEMITRGYEPGYAEDIKKAERIFGLD